MKNPLNKVGITFGIVLALYYILFNCTLFFTDKTLFANKFVGFFNMAVIIIIGVLCVFIARRKVGGYVTFREAFTPYLITIAIGVTVNYLMYNILFNLVDPSAKEVINTVLHDMLVDTLNNSGLPQEQINEQLSKSQELNQFEPKSQLFMWAGSILRMSILGLLLAAIFKNKSEFTNMNNDEAQEASTATDQNS
ncbi:putative membrane protein [Myroides gitamensis]|uniref:DUF4199 domain-containing protein n=1 Tax=Myroides odoratus TaxID=256 RepID=A0A378RQ37_MYROD|nr:DUF4199 domain-containing protein [Myroides odoratus]MCS4239146.1 putative membrane protein [Myroides odoratus]MDH6599553.1 putative membrane protein [Myroides gitamensis]QQU04311.1 DUF4199 domain-containing protein [Myroides odoratus]STZ28267.1 Uncharacterised protein [Myroides odoratus]